MNDQTPIGPGTRVTLNFALKLAGGELVDATDGKAATFSMGDGSLLPGFEQAILGLRAGAEQRFDIPADQGFGQPNEENIHILRKEEFSDSISLETGLVVSFADAEGHSLPGVVKRVFEDTVEVDFNHPLAGKDLIFEVEIIAVEQVSQEIARM